MTSSELDDYDSDQEPIDSVDGGDYGCESGGDDRQEFDSSDGGSDQQKVDNSCTVLDSAGIRRRLEDVIDQVSNSLSLSRSQSSILLRSHNWNVDRACEVWFAGEDKILEALGLIPKKTEFLEFEKAKISDSTEVYCGICLEFRPLNTTSAPPCGHYYCVECWKCYIGTSIADGSGCLMLQCPHPPCRVIIDQEMLNLLADEDQKEKFSQYLVRSYVEDGKKNIKWCPSPGCEYAVQFEAGGGAVGDVCCNCSYSFCWNCTEEAHRPVGCETVAKWIVKNSSEAENTNWILANSKPCPKCKKPIEKNHGCMHMTCSPPCRHEFCWMCLGDWNTHRENTGDLYDCNSYNKRKEDGEMDEDERIREMAKLSIEKYTHYYERWAGNHKSRQMALESMGALRVDDLRYKQDEIAVQMEFITDAWLQIVECRRVLKWTYAYGYYLPKDDPAKKHFFEYLQGEAEVRLEQLHECAETELKKYTDAISAAPTEEFNDFRRKLLGLTSVTKSYFENLVRALEGGLQDVISKS